MINRAHGIGEIVARYRSIYSLKNGQVEVVKSRTLGGCFFMIGWSGLIKLTEEHFERRADTDLVLDLVARLYSDAPKRGKCEIGHSSAVSKPTCHALVGCFRR